MSLVRRHGDEFLDARQMCGQRGAPMRRGGAGEFLFARGLRGFGGDFLPSHARFQIEQRELGVGEFLGLGTVFVQAQEPDCLVQQLDFNRQPAAFRLGGIPLGAESLYPSGPTN